MHIKLVFPLIVLFLASVSQSVYSGAYTINRESDGPFSFSLMGITINEGSSLYRESIVFNDLTCPIEVLNNSMNITYDDRGFRFHSTTMLKFKKKITALQACHILFDVFGQHMENLGNRQAKDFSPGTINISGEWRAWENDVSGFLTTVTYIQRARFEDGTQWLFNIDNLLLALSSLNLEKKIESDSGKEEKK